MTDDNGGEAPQQDRWHLTAARRLGWFTGWAQRGVTNAGRKLADAAAVGSAAAREVGEADAAEVEALVRRLAELVDERKGSVEQLARDPAFWLIIERLAQRRPTRLRRLGNETTDDTQEQADG